MRHLRNFSFIFLFLTIFFRYPAFSQDAVRLGKVGGLNQNYGEFYAVDIKKIKGVTYAFCVTSEGMAVFGVHYEETDQYITNAKVSLISFVSLGDCTDIEIEEGEGYEKDIYAYIAVKDKGLYIRNVTNPKFSYHVGSCNTPGSAEGVAISGKYAFVADGEEGLQVIDISNPTGPVSVGNPDIPGSAQGVTISGNYAFVAYWSGWPDYKRGLQVIDISDPTGPSIVGSCDIPGSPKEVAISGDYAFVAAYQSGLQVIDINNPNVPVIFDSCATPGYSIGVAISGDYAFVADEYSGLQVIDIFDPNGPVIVGSYDTPGEARGVAISGDYAFVADGYSSGLQVVDISNPTGPVIVDSCYTPGESIGIAISGDYAFVVYSPWWQFQHGSSLQVIDISNPAGPVIIGNCFIPGYAQGVAISESGDYAFVLYSSSPWTSSPEPSGLQVIDISNPTKPVIIGSCYTRMSAQGFTISGEYAFVVYSHGWSFPPQSGLQVFDISDLNGPVSISSCDTPGHAQGVAISKGYAFVADGGSGLQVIDISDPTDPSIVGTCDTPSWAFGVAISGEYAFVTDGQSGLQVIDIGDPNGPVRVGSCDTPGEAGEVAISGNYAFVAHGISALQVIDISDPNVPIGVGSYDTPGNAMEVAVSGDYAFIADGKRGFLKLKIDIGPPPAGKGNLILVAGGNINYKILSQQTESSLITTNTGQFGQIETNASYWKITQDLANYVFNTFINSGYEVYDLYYFNPDPVQDTDNDGIPNDLVVDEINPTREGLMDIIEEFPQDHIENTGPLYICLIGHGAEDKFLIMANEIITARDLKDAIDVFQENTHRQVVVIIESAASGTFIDDLTGFNITVITSTGDGASYIKPIAGEGLSSIEYIAGDGASYIKSTVGDRLSSIEYISEGQGTQYNSFITAFINNLAPYLYPEPITVGSTYGIAFPFIFPHLKEAFLSARNQLESWTLLGHPFADQTPQMAWPYPRVTSIYFSKDGITPVDHISISSVPSLTSIGNTTVDHIFINSITSITSIAENTPNVIALIGEDPNHNLIPIPQDMGITFFSSDPEILDPASAEDIQKTDSWYEITPRKNGRFTLIAHAETNSLLSAGLDIEASLNDPNYAADPIRMAIIVAGYKGTGDRLWESINNITNHAYKTLRAMGYSKDEIYYLNPYLLQDLDKNGEFDEIDGYPGLDIFDTEESLNAQLSPFAKIRQSYTSLKELFIFIAAPGTQPTFSLNPTESLTPDYLIDRIKEIADKISGKITFLYDACYSEGFISIIEEHQESSLGQKLLVITSTGPNQVAYYLNKGIVSFSYPFFNEWYMTNSLTRAFTYAKETLPYADPNLPEAQTPQISDKALATLWDQNTIYYSDETRPVFGEVQAYRSKGILHLTANVFSLTGIDKIFAIVERESSNTSLTSSYGKAISEGPLFYLSTRFNDPNAYVYGGDYELTIPDPCPNEETYIIKIYAMDKSRLPKIASYKTGISNPVQHKTKVIIIASDPGLFQTVQERQRLSAQIGRAEAILEGKGLSKTYEDVFGDILTISGQDINSMKDLWNNFSSLPSMAEGQTFLIYLIGHSELVQDNSEFVQDNPGLVQDNSELVQNNPGLVQDNNIPIFYINANVMLTPQQFSAYIPRDPNERLLILMDSPYAEQFLSAIDPDTLPRDWAGIASTNKGHLFFPIDGRFFPCFSNFFFSMILSGATVSQAYRIAENAVSLTQQSPGLFLPEETIDSDTINRHLGYYLGTSAIRGEDYSLFSECTAESSIQLDTQIKEYLLSLTAHTDANIDMAWAVLNSQTDISQKNLIVDFDTNDPDMIQVGAPGPIYKANVSSEEQYYNAFFIVEGRLDGETDPQKTWTKWQDVHITQDITQIDHDRFEPDDDPNQIILEISGKVVKSHKIVVNDPPQEHTFYCEDPNGCVDIDFVYFYGLKGHIYEIYAGDRSKNNHLIQLALYDSNIQPLYEKEESLISNNYLFFSCKQSGYYLIMIQSATSYKGMVGYVVGFTDTALPKIYGTLLLEVIDPWERGRPCVRWQLEGDSENEGYGENEGYSPPDGYLFIYPETYYYKVNKIDESVSGDIKIKVYSGDQCMDQCSECSGDPQAETSVMILHYYLNKAEIDLSNIPPDPIEPDPGYDDTNYIEIITFFKNDIGNVWYPWDPNIFVPDGDIDPNFPQEGDYDGDKICNLYEIFCYKSYPHYPTFPLSLHKGINLYYFPKIKEFSNIIPSGQIEYYYYDNSSNTWEYKEHGMIKSNTFNVIYIPPDGGMLSLELIVPNHPVFCLKGPMDPNYFLQHEPNEIKEYLNQNEVWSRFIEIDSSRDPNFPTLRWKPYEIDYIIGPAALIIDESNRPKLLVKDMSTDTNNYQTKQEDAIIDFPFISVDLFSYTILPYSIPITRNIDLPEGWNMISLPVKPDSTVVSNIFTNSEVVYGYKMGEGYVRVKKQEELQERKGYWVLLDTNQRYPLTGEPILLDPLPVHENGWKMIGGISFPVRPSVDNGNIEVIYRYVPGIGYQQVLEAENLEPGEGYWILVKGISD